jgi:hypothetical protein
MNKKSASPTQPSPKGRANDEVPFSVLMSYSSSPALLPGRRVEQPVATSPQPLFKGEGLD